MFLNDTLLTIMLTANMMATIPNETDSDSRQIEDQINKINITTTTLSPEEEENKFDFADGEYEFKLKYSRKIHLLFSYLKKWNKNGY